MVAINQILPYSSRVPLMNSASRGTMHSRQANVLAGNVQYMQSTSDSKQSEPSIWKQLGRALKQVGMWMKDSIGLLAIGGAAILTLIFAGGMLKIRKEETESKGFFRNLWPFGKKR